MNRTTRIGRKTRIGMAIGAGVLGVGALAATALGSGPIDSDNHPITGDALDKASAAALDATGGGTVSETEVGDEDSFYEVEVTLVDGSQVDVQLDENFAVVSSSADVEESGDSDGEG